MCWLIFFSSSAIGKADSSMWYLISSPQESQAVAASLPITALRIGSGDERKQLGHVTTTYPLIGLGSQTGALSSLAGWARMGECDNNPRTAATKLVREFGPFSMYWSHRIFGAIAGVNSALNAITDMPGNLRRTTLSNSNPDMFGIRSAEISKSG
jgi:hypothetical protein